MIRHDHASSLLKATHNAWLDQHAEQPSKSSMGTKRRVQVADACDVSGTDETTVVNGPREKRRLG
jgi:hypothetical protein